VAQALLEAERAATVQFERIARRYCAMGWQLAIGSSGTARMLAAFKVFGITHMIASEPDPRFGVLHGLMSKH
jgi:exopolyphosphatase/pppGpp-phosphohydrolase